MRPNLSVSFISLDVSARIGEMHKSIYIYIYRYEGKMVLKNILGKIFLRIIILGFRV